MVVARKSQKPFGDFTHPRRHVFDAVLKHGWPSAHAMAPPWREKNNLKPLHNAPQPPQRSLGSTLKCPQRPMITLIPSQTEPTTFFVIPH
jgi:hypothetical protein